MKTILAFRLRTIKIEEDSKIKKVCSSDSEESIFKKLDAVIIDEISKKHKYA